MYFDKFPKLLHSYTAKNGQDVLVLLKDITRNVRFRNEVLSNITLYDEYDLSDGETPEIVSEKVYGTPHYDWVIMLLNEKYDYLTDFPLPQEQLFVFTTRKYGSGNEYSTHHYENSAGFIVSSDLLGASPISNYDCEDRANEKKRKIKLVSPELMDTIVSNFEALVA